MREPGGGGGAPHRPGPPVLEAESITVRYGSVLALDDVSLTVPAACVTCLLGDNGAGKSTLIKVLSGVIPPAAGRVRLDGAELLLRSPREARDRGIATLYQDLALAPLMSVWRNFVLGAEPLRGRGPFRRLDGAAARAAARERLAAMGVKIPDVSVAVGRLSGGQRQAVAIARAVHHGARVLILDEPTAALGVRQAENVLAAIRRARDHGTAVVLVTHNPLHAHPVGDRFVILRQGRVAGTWRREELDAARLARLMAGLEP